MDNSSFTFRTCQNRSPVLGEFIVIYALYAAQPHPRAVCGNKSMRHSRTVEPHNVDGTSIGFEVGQFCRPLSALERVFQFACQPHLPSIICLSDETAIKRLKNGRCCRNSWFQNRDNPNRFTPHHLPRPFGHLPRHRLLDSSPSPWSPNSLHYLWYLSVSQQPS